MTELRSCKSASELQGQGEIHKKIQPEQEIRIPTGHFIGMIAGRTVLLVVIFMYRRDGSDRRIVALSQAIRRKCLDEVVDENNRDDG
jgi:hypothetical protein